MVELLTIEKRRLLAVNGYVTTSDFRAAWERCWEIMVDERAWPHATRFRRGWRAAQFATRREMCAAFVNSPTAFSTATEQLVVAASRMGVTIHVDDLPRALLAAIAYVQGEDELEAARDHAAARVFVAAGESHAA